MTDQAGLQRELTSHDWRPAFAIAVSDVSVGCSFASFDDEKRFEVPARVDPADCDDAHFDGE
jgi:hypothetical protein